MPSLAAIGILIVWDVMVLVCYVILQDRVIEGSCDFMGGTSSWYVIPLPRFVTIDIAVVEIWWF